MPHIGAGQFSSLDRVWSGGQASCSGPAGCAASPAPQPLSSRRACRQQRRLRTEAALWEELGTAPLPCWISAEPGSCSSRQVACWQASRSALQVAVQARPVPEYAAPSFHKRGTQQTAQAVLNIRKFDYSCYQRLQSGQITEGFLWQRMSPALSYLSEEEQVRVQEALSLAYDCHAGQMRKSGEPYITHPVEVALILARLRMDAVSVIAGLLHDTVEDCDQVSFDEIEVAFGAQVRVIVEGETRFSKVTAPSSAASSADAKALDLQQLFVAMTKELRIAVVKLADRLHNMRTLGSMRPDKQAKIAQETLQVFAPLARMLGLHTLVVELEDLSFAYCHPDDYALLKAAMAQIVTDQRVAIEQAQDRLQHALEIDPTLSGRQVGVRVEFQQRSLYSVYRKLLATNTSGESFKRLLAHLRNTPQLRVILDLPSGHSAQLYGGAAQLCYHCLGLVHAMWTPVPGAIKDYIATPKSNGYKSLHTTVLPIGTTEDLFPVEVHFRTALMHREAEFGIAGDNFAAATEALNAETVPHTASRGLPHDSLANLPKELVQQILRLAPFGLASSFLGASSVPSNGHSKPANGVPAAGRANGYSNGQAHIQAPTYGPLRLDEAVMARRVQWLKAIREWQEEFLDLMSAADFVDCILGDLMGKSVFVFTPSGDLLRLPKGATVVDFAYSVHTVVGNQMVSARVNGKHVGASHVLSDADVVEIRRYEGPVTSCQIATHQKWLAFTATKAARHKLARFVREHSHWPLEAEWGSTTVVQLHIEVSRDSVAQQALPDLAAGHGFVLQDQPPDPRPTSVAFTLEGPRAACADLCAAMSDLQGAEYCGPLGSASPLYASGEPPVAPAV